MNDDTQDFVNFSDDDSYEDSSSNSNDDSYENLPIYTFEDSSDEDMFPHRDDVYREVIDEPGISDVDFILICEYIKQYSIKNLEIINIVLNETKTAALASLIEANTKSLICLRLKVCTFQKPENFLTLAAAFASNNNLLDVDLHQTIFDEQYLDVFTDAITKSAINSIYLSYTGISNEGVKKLLPLLENSNVSGIVIDGNNKINDEIIPDILTSLEHNDALGVFGLFNTSVSNYNRERINEALSYEEKIKRRDLMFIPKR